MKKQLPMMPPQSVFQNDEQSQEKNNDVLEQIGLYDCYNNAKNSIHTKNEEIKERRK